MFNTGLDLFKAMICNLSFVWLYIAKVKRFGQGQHGRQIQTLTHADSPASTIYVSCLWIGSVDIGLEWAQCETINNQLIIKIKYNHISILKICVTEFLVLHVPVYRITTPIYICIVIKQKFLKLCNVNVSKNNMKINQNNNFKFVGSLVYI